MYSTTKRSVPKLPASEFALHARRRRADVGHGLLELLRRDAEALTPICDCFRIREINPGQVPWCRLLVRHLTTFYCRCWDLPC